MPPKTKAPTTELGRPSMTAVGGGILPWSAFIDDREYAPDVQWPKSVDTYARMQTDAQLKGLLLATTLPIRRFRWEIDPNGARPEVVEHIATGRNLPIRGQEPGPQRRRHRFSHDKHLAHALRALPYGHFYFEQVFEYQDPTEGGDGLLHLRKLGTRPPRTINDIVLEEDGGLKGIRQNVTFDFTNTDKLLGVERLVAYVWDSEDDGDWIGRSMLRACFRNWLVKDRLIRIDATKHERNGMGIPWFEADPSASKKQVEDLAAIAERMRAGELSGGAGPGKLSLKGVDGTLPDTILSIREHDHQMSRAFLALFFELGTSETGSRALGSDFIDFFTGSQGSIADWYRDVTQAHDIEDEVELNWGPDEQPPLLVYERVEEEALSIADLSTAVEKGLIAVDDELAEYVVRRWHLPRGVGAPEKPEPPEEPPPPPPGEEPPEDAPEGPEDAPEPPPAARGRPRRTVLAAETTLSLPDRELRRQPYAQEVQAQVDFAGVERSFLTTRDALIAAVQSAQAEQIDALVSAVEANAGDATALATLEVDPIDWTLIAGFMRKAAAEGEASAREEHMAQVGPEPQSAAWRRGDPIRRPVTAADADQDEVNETLDDRAQAVALLLAAGLAASASKRASAVAGLSAADAGAAVRTHLEGLSGAELDTQLGGATWEGFNAGRKGYMRANDPEHVYASELLDSNTCQPCMGIDGTEWDSVEDAEGAAYPQGGYLYCAGGLRCRGTLVATYTGG
jgi:hypothetical protein